VSFDLPHDEYEHLAARFQLYTDEERNAERYAQRFAAGKPRKAAKAGADRKQPPGAVAHAEAQPQLEDGFRTTYQPARYEGPFLQESLQPFVTQTLIDDVLALVKGGKEANVYLCQAAPHLDVRLIAAKVYRPRQFRNLRNDVTYREGRELVNSLGITIKNRDNREMRAIHKKTSYGAELTHVSWLMHEHITLQRLHNLGAAVPKPLGVGQNAILMEYVGDRNRPAPVLHGVALPPGEAGRLCDEVLRNAELMLAHGMIHGDLSAYNILYWEGKVTLIDFPQVTMSESNHNAYRIFQRDVRRVCEYFAAQGVERNADAIVHRLWGRYVRTAPDRTVHDHE
jgi:RIO kinase 1